MALKSHFGGPTDTESEPSINMTSKVNLYIIFISLSLSSHTLSPNSELTELPELYAIPGMSHRVALFCKNNFVLYFLKKTWKILLVKSESQFAFEFS